MRTIAITSGKGGVGKTALTANLGISLAKQGLRVVLFDADLQLANLDVVLGVKPEFNLQHVVAEEKALRDILTVGPSGVLVATGGSAVTSLMHAGPKRMGTFIAQLEALERVCDVLIFDTGAGLDNRVMTFVRLADDVILVTTPEPTSVTDAYATAKVAFRRDPDAVLGVVVNGCSGDAEGRLVHSSLDTIARSFLGRSLGYLGSVRRDDAVPESIRRREPFVLASPHAACSKDVTHLAKNLLGATQSSVRARAA